MNIKLFPRQTFCFFPSTVFAVEETLLSCFLPFLALKLANTLLICVGHNTGKQGCFLLHHFLWIDTYLTMALLAQFSYSEVC